MASQETTGHLVCRPTGRVWPWKSIATIQVVISRIFEIGGERHERVTFAPDRHNSAVVWSPDGERIAFHRSRCFSTQVLVKTASGASDVEELVDFDVVASPTDWSMDGRHLLIDEHSDDRGWNIWSISMPAEGEPEAFLTTAANEMQGVFSPDGNWVAYASDESGRFEIYLRPFPPAGDARWQLTSDGGEAPKWRGDGRELFYVAPGSRFMALSVSLEARPDWSSPVQLFQHVVRRAPGEIRDLPPYDVTADGETFSVERRRWSGLSLHGHRELAGAFASELSRSLDAKPPRRARICALPSATSFAHCEVFHRFPVLPPIYSRLLFPSSPLKKSYSAAIFL